MKFENGIICGDWIKVLEPVPDDTFHCVVTSPPYWGQRDYGCEGQLGLEKTPEEHIEKLVEGFREVRRVLRPDGVLWLNYGDKYSNDSKWGGQSGNKNETSSAGGYSREKKTTGNGQGNLLMLPARVALALQADGWILRDDVIWAKAISFNDKYSGSTMPESVNGTRWERHRIKVEGPKYNVAGKMKTRQEIDELNKDWQLNTAYKAAKYIDCPGCEKCEPNGGYVLRKGSWRCTKAHEHLFQLVKSGDYFCDMEAVKESSLTEPHASGYTSGENYATGPMSRGGNSQREDPERVWGVSGRNLRNVWTINPRGYKEAHYATYPEALVEPCIKVSTSQKGVCPKCGAQWARVVDVNQQKLTGSTGKTKVPGAQNWEGVTDRTNRISKTIGWKPTCDCGIKETVPALVLDPFMGSGTTAVVAAKLGRNYYGCEINPEYKKNHIDKRVREFETGVPIAAAEAGQGGLFE